MSNLVLYYATIRGLAHEEAKEDHAKPVAEVKKEEHKPAPVAEVKKEEPKPAAKEEDDMDDLFEADEEAQEADKKRRQEEADAKKKAKPEVIQKSNLILDVKPLDDQTDMKEVEEKVRAIELNGLTWGPSKLVKVAYGIEKLQISAVMVDDLVCTDDIEDKIMEFEDLVQSIDVAALTKV